MAAWALAVDQAEPCSVRVIEGRVAIFASTNAVREAVAWQPSGTELVVRGELTDEAWVCVEPPENVSVWVYRELVKEGVVIADKSRVRAGAGLTFRSVGSLNKGEHVEVRGFYGDWLKVKPPPDVKFWVLRDQVEPLAAMSPEGVETNLMDEGVSGSVTNDPVAVVVRAWAVAVPPVAVQPAPTELSGFVLDNTPEQGAKVVLRGILDWGMVGVATAPFCLVALQADGDTAPVCHLMAPVLTYSPHIGASVVVEGTRWRVTGLKLPIVIPASVRVE
ncbi:MAG: SH3 domain-containing protein [bacterium]